MPLYRAKTRWRSKVIAAPNDGRMTEIKFAGLCTSIAIKVKSVPRGALAEDAYHGMISLEGLTVAETVGRRCAFRYPSPRPAHVAQSRKLRGQT